MQIKIHRGQNQIGGSIIEISTEYTKVIFDVGINLDELSDVEIPQIEGLFCGNPTYDAVFVSHYHSDHIGLLDYVLEEIPVYIGKQAYGIAKSAAQYCGREITYNPLFVEDKKEIQIGDLSILPIKCDHSAYDSYMFLISDSEKSILYTGDFRANGHLKYNELLEQLPQVDALIIEGTMLSRETYQDNITEKQLEDIALKVLEQYTGPAFLMCSAMNVDRVITGYNIAMGSNRLFLEDLYSAGIMKSIGANVPVPGKDGIRVFMTGGDKQYELLKQYSDCKIGKTGISKSKFLMCVRPSMRNYLCKLNEECSFKNGVLFYSMWKGYQERIEIKEFLEWISSLGIKIHVLHTSGHADISTIELLVRKTKPTVIIPIHTENASWYERFGVTVVLEKNIVNI